MNRWQSKAAAYVAGWRSLFGADPTPVNVPLGLAVAEHETRCGDAKGWEGENNWGACQDTDKDAAAKMRAALVGLAPHPSTVATARAKLAEAGLRTAGLHVDSSPGKGYYWQYFRCFPTEAEGAADFIKVIAVNAGRGASCKPALELGAVSSLARAMYNTRYYEGFHEKDALYERGADGGWRKSPTGTVFGSELNIASYARALYALVPTITAGIGGEAPRPTIKRGSRGVFVKEWQRIIGVPDDGVFGPKTEAATILWQQSNHLTPDGIVGPRTWAAGLAP